MEVPEAAKVAFGATSLELVAVSVLLLATSVSITVLLLVMVEAMLSMLSSIISMKAEYFGGIVVSLAPAGWPVEQWWSESGIRLVAAAALLEPNLFLLSLPETRAARLREIWAAVKTVCHYAQPFLTSGSPSDLGGVVRG